MDIKQLQLGIKVAATICIFLSRFYVEQNLGLTTGAIDALIVYALWRC